MRASGESLAVNELRGATRDCVPPMGRELMLDTDSPTLSVTLPEDNCFCGECGQLLAGQPTATTWNGTTYPRWAWGLIALGVALTVMFGGTALAAARERAATQEILRTLPAWEPRLEGPSVQRAALQVESAPGAVDRYLAADHDLNRALPDAGFGLVTIVLGISLLARWSAQRTGARRVRATGASKPPALLDPIRRALFDGWTLAEGIAVAAFRLLTVAFLYLLVARIGAGGPPTLDVVQETLDQLVQIVTRLPELLR